MFRWQGRDWLEGDGVLGEGEGEVLHDCGGTPEPLWKLSTTLADTSSDPANPSSSKLELSMSRSSRMERGAMLSMLEWPLGLWWSCLEQRQGVSYNSTAS